jgi:8-oxo-dGTP pyrophosphatase MutT (NUDIX family)
MLIRSSIRILLINKDNKLLLMRVVDPSTMLIGGTAHPVFWCTIGGKIEINESIEQAAYRELYEETGLTDQDVSFGPIV